LYDQLKASSEKALIEISEYKNDVENKGKAKLSKYCETLNSVKENIKNETNRIIQLVKKNEKKLLNETIEIEKYLKENLCLSEPELNEMRALVVKKILIEANSFSEEHLVDLVEKTDRIKIKLKEAENKIEYFNENISLSFNENALLIGEIQTNKKVNFVLE
jgi:membrane-associated HD superfamily phosphohydrolase